MLLSGWFAFESNTFLFVVGFMGRVTGPYGPSNWTTAKADCESKGLRLMTIDSQEEENYVNNTLQPNFE